jgi:hypothetical protein
MRNGGDERIVRLIHCLSAWTAEDEGLVHLEMLRAMANVVLELGE